MVVIFWAEELVEWNAHPGELTSNHPLAEYLPALDRWLACEPFTFDCDTDL